MNHVFYIIVYAVIFISGCSGSGSVSKADYDLTAGADDQTTDEEKDDALDDIDNSVDYDNSADNDNAVDIDETHDEDAGMLHKLTVINGYGSGDYAAGSVVHIWAELSPETELLNKWTGETGLLDRSAEWHTTLIIPEHQVTLEAVIESRSEVLTEISFAGSTAFDKQLFYYAPDNPKGLVFFLHGTGGSSSMINKNEVRYIAAEAILRGYAVVSFEAEEVAQGDLDGNGKVRWNPDLSADNKDFANLDMLVTWLRNEGIIEIQTPLFAIGMSNGGAMSVGLGALSASDVSADFSNLNFAAVVSYCASGRASAAQITVTPTAWFLCANDDNEEVSNEEALKNSENLTKRGIDTIADLHQASPLYNERFMRVEGLSAEISGSIAAELRNAGFVDSAGMFIVQTDNILSYVQDNPSSFSVTLSLSSDRRKDVVDQIKVMQAEHQIYSDWTARTIDFLDTHLP